jgi:hypothetical protein
MVDVAQNIPIRNAPIIHDDGTATQSFWSFLQTLWLRTGSAAGVLSAMIQATATAALAAANAALVQAALSLKKASNLSDLANASDARDNLGLGPIATSATVIGWEDPTGAGSRATFNMDLALPVGVAYSQAEVLAIANQVIVLQKRLGQLVLDEKTVKTIGA